ncbi:MAG: YkgJ family cysteine cluster protein [Acidimicrobiia bacterium]
MTALRPSPELELAPVDWAAPHEDPVSQIERQIVRGSHFTQAALDQLMGRLAAAEEYIGDLVELLRARGVLGEGDLSGDEQDQVAGAEGAGAEAVAEATGASPNGSASEPGRHAPEIGDSETPAVSWPGIAFRVEPENHQEVVVEVDCEKRMPICHAVCCKLNFALTPPEVEEGGVKWDLGFPYLIRHEENGYCTHCDTGSGRCGVYADRPGVCRRYSCANDQRIWSDFEAMELNEDWIRSHLGNQSRIFVRTSLPVMDAGALDPSSGPVQFETA